MGKIIILDGYTIHPSEAELQMFRSLGEVTVYERTPAELTIERMKEAEYVFTDSTYIGKEAIDHCPSLKWIGILATGVNAVDVAYAKEKGIPVCNVPAYGSDVVAQHAFALLLYGCNQLKHYDSYVQNGSWKKNEKRQQEYLVPYWDNPVYSLSGKTMGIFGFGPIAKNSARIARGFGMNVLIHTKHPDLSWVDDRLQFVDAPELMSRSHVINLHCPLTDENVGFIDKKAIDSMLDGVILINTARGKLIDEEALAAALLSGKVAFAGLDVLSAEPPPADHPLLHVKNCYITPHAAWTSEEARQRILRIAAENLRNFQHGTLSNCVTTRDK